MFTDKVQSILDSNRKLSAALARTTAPKPSKLERLTQELTAATETLKAAKTYPEVLQAVEIQRGALRRVNREIQLLDLRNRMIGTVVSVALTILFVLSLYVAIGR